eukprot:3848849-Rhodomonas_salina.2
METNAEQKSLQLSPSLRALSLSVCFALALHCPEECGCGMPGPQRSIPRLGTELCANARAAGARVKREELDETVWLGEGAEVEAHMLRVCHDDQVTLHPAAFLPCCDISPSKLLWTCDEASAALLRVSATTTSFWPFSANVCDVATSVTFL